MKITSRGQVTIPQAIREKFGLLPDTEVEFVVKRNAVHLVKTRSRDRASSGEAIVRRLKGTATVRMSTDEILRLTRR